MKVNTQLPAKKAGSVQNALSLNIFVCSSECRPTDSAQPQLGSLEYAKTTNLSSYPTEDYRLNKHQTLYGKFMGPFSTKLSPYWTVITSASAGF